MEFVTNALVSLVVSGVSPVGAVLLKDGNATSESVAYSQISPGFFKAAFTPTSTGIYSLIFSNVLQWQIQVVAKSSQSFLRNLEDEALGSWQWDKLTKRLTMIRQDGTTMATFEVQDSLDLSSRERIT